MNPRRPRGLLQDTEPALAVAARVVLLSLLAASLFALTLAVTVLVVTD